MITDEMVRAALGAYYLRTTRPDDITVWSDRDIRDMRAALEAAERERVAQAEPGVAP